MHACSTESLTPFPVQQLEQHFLLVHDSGPPDAGHRSVRSDVDWMSGRVRLITYLKFLNDTILAMHTVQRGWAGVYVDGIRPLSADLRQTYIDTASC